MIIISKIMKDFIVIFLEHVLAGKSTVTMRSVKKFIGHMSSFITPAYFWRGGLEEFFLEET